MKSSSWVSFVCRHGLCLGFFRAHAFLCFFPDFDVYKSVKVLSSFVSTTFFFGYWLLLFFSTHSIFSPLIRSFQFVSISLGTFIYLLTSLEFPLGGSEWSRLVYAAQNYWKLCFDLLFFFVWFFLLNQQLMLLLLLFRWITWLSLR